MNVWTFAHVGGWNSNFSLEKLSSLSIFRVPDFSLSDQRGPKTLCLWSGFVLAGAVGYLSGSMGSLLSCGSGFLSGVGPIDLFWVFDGYLEINDWNLDEYWLTQHSKNLENVVQVFWNAESRSTNA